MIKIGNNWFKWNEIVSIRGLERWDHCSFQVVLKSGEVVWVGKYSDYEGLLKSDVYQDVLKAAELLSNIYFGNS